MIKIIKKQINMSDELETKLNGLANLVINLIKL